MRESRIRESRIDDRSFLPFRAICYTTITPEMLKSSLFDSQFP